MKSESRYYSCWYNRLQGALFLLAFLTFGIGDTITSIWMIERRGIMGEGNLIIRYIILDYGIPNYIVIKLSVTIVLLVIPFLIREEAVYWMINGYIVSFIVAGTLGIVLNIQAARNDVSFLSPEQVIFLYIVLIFILTSIGEEIDKQTHPRIRPYVDCLFHDIAIILIRIDSIFKNKN